MFCYIYNVFYVSYRFFSAEFNPISASLKRLGICLTSRSKVNSKAKYDFSTTEARNKCIPQFHVILTVLFSCEIILIISGHLQGRKVNFKVK